MDTLEVTYQFSSLEKLLEDTERYKTLYLSNNLEVEIDILIGNNNFISIFVLK